MTDERKISKATALDELSGLFEQVAADPGGEWLNGGHASTLGWAANTLTDFEARVRAEVGQQHEREQAVIAAAHAMADLELGRTFGPRYPVRRALIDAVDRLDAGEKADTP